MARYPKDSSPKLTRDLISQICSALRNGCYVETAVAYCGISKNTFYRWLRLANTDDSNTLYKELSHAIEIAFAQSEMRDIEVINKSAQGSPDILVYDDEGNILLDSKGNPIISEYGLPPNWKAAAWRLERRNPSRWGKQCQVELSHNEDNKIEIVFCDPKVEE